MASIGVLNAARVRKVRTALNKDIKIQWFIRELSDTVAFSMRKRILLATQLVHSRIVQNISRPVTKTRGPRGGHVVTNRSKPGEYPKSETSRLLDSIFFVVVSPRKRVWEGRIGTGVFYGGILERSKTLDRNYAARTLRETAPLVFQILSGPIK